VRQADLPEKKKRAALLGLGLDNDDETVRITRGENFHLLGGSEDTHRQMQEKCIKFNEKLKGRGKQLEDLRHGEFLDLAAECDMNVPGGRGRRPEPDEPDERQGEGPAEG